MLTKVNYINNHKNVTKIIFVHQQLDYMKKSKVYDDKWRRMNIITQRGFGNIKGNELSKTILIFWLQIWTQELSITSQILLYIEFWVKRDPLFNHFCVLFLVFLQFLSTIEWENFY
jgi:hypothetical protein